MIKIALAQMEVIPGRPQLNYNKMIDMIEAAKAAHAEIIVFPEMAIPGYFLGDWWEQSAFLRDCEHFGKLIIQASHNLCVVFGNIAVDWNKTGEDGRVRKYNALFVAYNGNLYGHDNFPYPFRIKTLQPNYREFDDTRHFYSLRKLAVELDTSINSLLQPVNITIANKQLKLGCMLCEDGWSDDYSIKPMSILQKNGPVDFFINISSSPFTMGKNNKRNRVFSAQTKMAGSPLLYVNNTGIQNNGKTIYSFDGFSTVYNGRGEITACCTPFAEEIKYTTIDLINTSTSQLQYLPDDNNIEHLYQALNFGVTRFLKTTGIKKVVIGVSGGIDSAVSAALYADIVGKENLLLVNMPSRYNSITTKTLAAELAKNIGCLYTVMPIQHVVDYTIKQVSEATVTNLSTGQSISIPVSSYVAENIQARDRSARVLAAIAAAWGGGFTCNANKSELTVGYSTLYGDNAGFLAALADLWKHQVYQLACYLNHTVFGREIIPQASIDIIPSAELSADQAIDEGKGDPIFYPYHDYLFRSFVEHWNKATPEDILSWYLDGTLENNIGCKQGLIAKLFPTPQDFIADLEKWWSLYSGMAVAKRIQAPPVLAVSRRAYGFDHREAQNGVYYTAKYQQLKDALLKKQGKDD